MSPRGYEEKHTANKKVPWADPDMSKLLNLYFLYGRMSYEVNTKLNTFVPFYSTSSQITFHASISPATFHFRFKLSKTHAIETN